MIFLKEKPLSVNDCWKGQRYKTDAYKNYEEALLLKLPKLEVPEGPLKITLEFGFSSGGSDWDNPIKPLVDILQKRYRFNDNRIKQASVTVSKCDKGAEYLAFKLESIENYLGG